MSANESCFILQELGVDSSEETLATVLGHEMAPLARLFALNLFMNLWPTDLIPPSQFAKLQIDRPEH